MIKLMWGTVQLGCRTANYMSIFMLVSLATIPLYARCTKQENGKQCKHYHHPLLHKSNAIRLGVAAVAAGKGALLPVMSAVIHGQNGIQKKRKHPPRCWRSSKSYPVRHCGVIWTQRKGHLCNHSRSWWRRGNHKNKGIPSTCQFWRWSQEVFDNCHWNPKHQWWRRSSSDYTDHWTPRTIQRED